MKRLIAISIVVFSIAACKEKTPPEPANKEIHVESCVDELMNDELDIVTWNLQEFPLAPTTPQYIDDIIHQMDADVIAVQEISSALALNEVIRYITPLGWKGMVHGVGDLKLGFLYNSKKVDLTDLVVLFDDDPVAFPRPVIKTKITTKANVFGVTTDVWLFNVHLKCCDGADNIKRRKDAITRIKTYIIGVHPDDKVVITGDFNDVLDADPNINVFTPILSDTPNFTIADMDIATGNPNLWSYPSFPSHLDHFIISNELFGKVELIKTVLLEDCIHDYDVNVSDHRPVLLSLQP